VDYVPTAAILRNELWAKFMSKPGEKPELGTMSLEHACALIEAKIGWKVLREYTVKRFNCRLPLWQHSILPLLSPKAIFTTNYDNLVELGWARQLGRAGVPNYALTFRAEGASHLSNIPLFKPHGTVEQSKAKVLEGGLVLSLFDYFEIIGSYQEMLRKFLQDFSDRCVVFIGYSFMDMDIGAEIYRMRKRDKGVHWYAVFPRDDADVKSMYQDQFAIKQINRTFFDFLTDLDAEKNIIPPEWKADRIQALKEAALIQ
jgi:SIR2-like domain